MDTGVAQPYMVADATISALLAKFSVEETAAQVAESLAAFFAQKAQSVTQRFVKADYAKREQFFMNLAKTIRENAEPDPNSPPLYGSAYGVMQEADQSYNLNYQQNLDILDPAALDPANSSGPFSAYPPVSPIAPGGELNPLNFDDSI